MLTRDNKIVSIPQTALILCWLAYKLRSSSDTQSLQYVVDNMLEFSLHAWFFFE